MSVLITICARGGSKGIPGKNTRLLNGKPLIGYSISIAAEFAKAFNGELALSTDDETIKRVAASLGLETDYLRPPHLATDDAGKIDTIKDLLLFQEKRNNKTYDYVLDLDVTSPLRTIKDLTEAFKEFKQEEEALTLFSVNNAGRNPYFNMVELQEDGFYYLVKTRDGSQLTRQAAPPVYDLNASFYFYRRQFFDTGHKSPITKRSMIYLMQHLCFDLDHPIDFDFLEFLIKNDKLDFPLI